MAALEGARQVTAARIIVAAATAPSVGARPSDVILEELDRLDPYATAVAAAAIVDKLIGDVSAFVRVDREATLANMGRWVSAHELEEV